MAEDFVFEEVSNVFKGYTYKIILEHVIEIKVHQIK